MDSKKTNHMTDENLQQKYQYNLSALSERDKWRLYSDLKSALEPYLTGNCNRSQLSRTLADMLGI